MTPAIPFASVAEADAYHADHLFSATWDDADPEDKPKALVTASRLLLAHVPWLTRALWFYTTTPDVLRDATAEFARKLLEYGDPFAASDTAGIKKMKAGPVDVEFEALDTVPVPPEVLQMLAPLAFTQQSSINVPLVRY